MLLVLNCRMLWALNWGGVKMPLTAITRCWTLPLSVAPLSSSRARNPLQVAELYGKTAWLIILVSFSDDVRAYAHAPVLTREMG